MIGFPRFRSTRVLASITLGLSLPVMFPSAGLAQQRVVESDGFLVGKEPATRNLLVDGKQLTGKRGAEILLSCGGEVLLYVCTGANCSIIACALKAGDKVDDVEAKKWSFKPEPKRESPDGLIARGLAWLATRDPKPAAIAAARAMGEPVDAVVLLDEKGVHFAPALSSVLEGNYCLTLGTLPASARTWTTTLQWDRRREPEGIAAVPDLPPGLYSLRKGLAGGPGCTPNTNADEGWVLVAGPAQFPELDAEWRSYAGAVEEFERSGVSPNLVTTLRRAALAGRAEP